MNTPGRFLIAAAALAGAMAFQPTLAGGGSGGTGGGGCLTSAVLPTVAPAPDVILRESFGMGNNQLRPAGGKGCLKDDPTHTGIQGFWLEYPGGKNTAWLAPSAGQTWKFCAASIDPNELPSPLQPAGMNGCAASEWFDPVVDHPVALMPFTAPAGTYQVSIDGYPAPVAGYYIGVGFTDSAVLYSNLETGAPVWLRLKPNAAFDGTTVVYELRLDGMSGAVLATGELPSLGFNQLLLRYDPALQMVSARVNDAELGWFPLVMSAPRFVGFEGVGIVDNFVVRGPQ
jgi:hypothetical protein